ncbi:MAG: response regulator [Actinobacteria bacterium]|nr:response regulator [Actinomycetota bacterium]
MDAEGPLKTFLIADVRGYTRFTHEHGDEAAAELAVRFSDLVRRTVEELGGAVVEFRGDEALVAFDSPRRAIQAAVELQARFVHETFEEPGGLSLPVGIGLDVGEAVHVDDGYRGNALNLAARLCGLARAGEILSSREVTHLAGRIEGVAYEDKGSMRFKNIDEPVRIVRVVPSGVDPAERFASLGDPLRGGLESGPIRVLIADDSVLFREGVARLLTDWGFEVVGQAADAEELLARLIDVEPDVVVTDIRMPPTNTTEGLVAAQQIRDKFPEIGVLLLSQYVETRHAVKLLEQASDRVGYLLKDRVSDVSEFADAVRRVARGGSVIDPDVVARLLGRTRERSALEELTDREREILSLMAEGRSNRAICEHLFLSLKTVEAHIAHIFTKLGLEPAADDHRRVLAVVMHLRQH